MKPIWKRKKKTAWLLAAALAGMLAAPPVLADEEALMRKSGCFKCHAVDKKKDGPAYKDVAAKYKGKADAEKKLYTHLTTNPKVKIDGQEEEHETLKTKDDAEIKAVIHWVLSR